MKTTLCHLLILFAAFVALTEASAADSVTIIGSTIKTDFSAYGLKGRAFEWDALADMNADTEQKLCVAVKDSALVIFAAATPANVLDRLFASNPVNEALHALLERGGVLYFDPLYYDTLNQLPKSMTAFFKDADAYLINVSQYDGERHSYRAVPNPDLQHPYTATSDDAAAGQEAAEFSFAGALPASCKILLVDSATKAPLMILQENVLGKGQIINSYVYSVTRATSATLMGNILRALYGERKKIDRRAVIEEKLGIH